LLNCVTPKEFYNIISLSPACLRSFANLFQLLLQTLSSNKVCNLGANKANELSRGGSILGKTSRKEISTIDNFSLSGAG
jgi:hypothetical protein